MPMTLRGEETGVEFDLFDNTETIEKLARGSESPALIVWRVFVGAAIGLKWPPVTVSPRLLPQ